MTCTPFAPFVYTNYQSAYSTCTCDPRKPQIGMIMTDSKISPFSSPKLLLARLSRLTSTIPGLDASLMLAQYSSPLVIALLLRLAAFKARHPKVTLVSGAGKRTLTVNGGFGLAKIADGWGNAAGSIGDARVVMRAFGR